MKLYNYLFIILLITGLYSQDECEGLSVDDCEWLDFCVWDDEEDECYRLGDDDDEYECEGLGEEDCSWLDYCEWTDEGCVEIDNEEEDECEGLSVDDCEWLDFCVWDDEEDECYRLGDDDDEYECEGLGEEECIENYCCIPNYGWDEEYEDCTRSLYDCEDNSDAYLMIGESSGIPGGETNLELFIESSVDVGGIQFNLNDDPDFVVANSFESYNDCFTTAVNDVDGYVIGIYFSPEGCILEAGFHHFGTLNYSISNDAEWGLEINLNFSELIISDADGLEIYSAESEVGIISIGLLGDVNIDGDIDILDLVQLVNFIITIDNPTLYQYWASDINNDDDLNILDVVQLINLILA